MSLHDICSVPYENTDRSTNNGQLQEEYIRFAMSYMWQSLISQLFVSFLAIGVFLLNWNFVAWLIYRYILVS